MFEWLNGWIDDQIGPRWEWRHTEPNGGVAVLVVRFLCDRLRFIRYHLLLCEFMIKTAQCSAMNAALTYTTNTGLCGIHANNNQRSAFALYVAQPTFNLYYWLCNECTTVFYLLRWLLLLLSSFSSLFSSCIFTTLFRWYNLLPIVLRLCVLYWTRTHHSIQSSLFEDRPQLIKHGLF